MALIVLRSAIKSEQPYSNSHEEHLSQFSLIRFDSEFFLQLEAVKTVSSHYIYYIFNMGLLGFILRNAAKAN